MRVYQCLENWYGCRFLWPNYDLRTPPPSPPNKKWQRHDETASGFNFPNATFEINVRSRLKSFLVFTSSNCRPTFYRRIFGLRKFSPKSDVGWSVCIHECFENKNKIAKIKLRTNFTENFKHKKFGSNFTYCQAQFLEFSALQLQKVACIKNC